MGNLQIAAISISCILLFCLIVSIIEIIKEQKTQTTYNMEHFVKVYVKDELPPKTMVNTVYLTNLGLLTLTWGSKLQWHEWYDINDFGGKILNPEWWLKPEMDKDGWKKFSDETPEPNRALYLANIGENNIGETDGYDIDSWFQREYVYWQYKNLPEPPKK